MREENIEKMNFKQLRGEVQLLRDELAIFKRKYEDAIYNLDSDNFGKSFTIAQDNMKAQIQITADALKSTVTETDLATELTKYSTIEQTAGKITSTVTETFVKNLLGDTYVTNAVMQTQIAQASDAILLSVASEYQTLDAAEDEYNSLSAQIELTANSITSAVSKNISAYFESLSKPTSQNTTDEQKTMLCLYGGTYYYFNDIADKWKEYPVDGITTMFKQTASGFALTGDVSISGDLIGGTISGVTITTSNENYWSKCVRLNAESHCLELIFNNAVVANWWVGDFGLTCLGPTYDNLLYIDDATPRGTWDFSECTVENLIVPARFG